MTFRSKLKKHEQVLNATGNRKKTTESKTIWLSYEFSIGWFSFKMTSQFLPRTHTLNWKVWMKILLTAKIATRKILNDCNNFDSLRSMIKKFIS